MTVSRDDGIILIALVLALGAYLALPKETIFQAVVAVITALLAAGWLAKKSRRRKSRS